MKRTVLVILLVAAMAGCSPTTPSPLSVSQIDANGSPLVASPRATGTSSAAGSSPIDTPTTTSTPSQDQIRIAAGKAYLAAVKPYNKTGAALDKKYRSKTSLAANRQYCARLAGLVRTELSALRAITYPEDTLADANALIRAQAAADADYRSCAIARNWVSWNRSWNLSAKAGDRAHEAANLVRLDLNLPSVPG